MPVWVPLACYTAIAAGTMSGGWKIVKTMGTRITKVTPFEGVAAETAGAITLFVTEALKIPVSTTHTITGSIIGVGATKRLSAVRWGVTVNLLWAWILTIPVSGALAALVYFHCSFNYLDLSILYFSFRLTDILHLCVQEKKAITYGYNTCYRRFRIYWLAYDR